MAEPAKPWDAVFSRIRALYRPESVYQPPPTPSEWQDVESQLGFQFPTSYKAFAERFGLDGEIFVLPSLLPLRDNPQGGWSVLRATLDLRATHHEYWYFRSDSPPLFDRMVVFAEDGGYEKFVFDPAEVTDSGGCEYRVYAIDKTADVERVGNNFPEFLEYIHDRYRPGDDDIEHWENDVELRQQEVAKPDTDAPNALDYRRRELRKKHAPSRKKVALWLAWNNHTARDLARAIREHGRTDAFPILADALQEAGCSNADLLDSCRTGDPDIDGAWVLQVLLGKP